MLAQWIKTGLPIRAHVRVYHRGTSTMAQPHNQDDQPIAQPLTVDRHGRVEAWLAPGPYKVTAQAPGYSECWPDVLVSEADALPPLGPDLTEGWRTRKLLMLDRDMERFVAYHSDGSDRYRPAKQIPMNALGTTALAILASPAASPEIKAYAQGKWDKLQQVMAWVGEVLEYQYEVRHELETASGLPDIQQVTWDFSFLEASDPGVTLEEVRL